MAKITFIGMYNYYDSLGKNLFDKLILPTGVDKSTVVESLLQKSGDFGVIYSDPDYVYQSFLTFSKKWMRTFTKWYDALQIEYNPLDNYDRTEEWEESTEGSNKKLGSEVNSSSMEYQGSEVNHNQTKGTITNAKDGSFTDHGRNTMAGSEDDTHYVSAYNSDAQTFDTKDSKTFNNRDNDNYQAHTYGNNYNIGDGSLVSDPYHESTHFGAYRKPDGTYADDDYFEENTKSFDNRKDVGSDTLSFNNREDKSESKLTHKGRLRGNIGITSSQQLLESELSIAEWNLYEHIVDIIMQEYCIMVY